MMVYLIDDKKNRQERSGWPVDRLSGYKSILCPIYNFDELNKIKNEIFRGSGNVFIFHDSFFDTADNKSAKSANEIWSSLRAEAKRMPIATFSGGIVNISFDRSDGRQYASIPVLQVYNNLEFYLKETMQNNAPADLAYLAFGKDHVLEEIEKCKMALWLELYDVPMNSEISSSGPVIKALVPLLQAMEVSDISGVMLQNNTPAKLKAHISHLVFNYCING